MSTVFPRRLKPYNLRSANNFETSNVRQGLREYYDRFFIPIKIPYCPKNEELSRNFINKLVMFTNNKFKFNTTWSTRKIRSLFPLKDRVKHVSCVCLYGETYIGETERIAEGRWSEHNAPSKNSEPAKHL